MSKQTNIKEERDVSGVPISLVVAMILAIAIVIFAIQNSYSVSLKLYAWHLDAPLSLLLFCTLGIGVIMAVLLSIPGWRRKRGVIKGLRREVKELSQRSMSNQNSPVNQ